MDIELLKQQTAAEHDRVEHTLGLMDARLDRVLYVEILQRFYGFVSGWERWAAQTPVPSLRTLLAPRLRGPLLLADLRFFSAFPRGPLYSGPSLLAASQAHVLGGLYVMEGSTLGGQYIARHVERALSLAPGVGDSFFRGHGEATGGMWRQVTEALRALPTSQTEEVVSAAKALFQDFALWNEQAPAGQPAEPAHV